MSDTLQHPPASKGPDDNGWTFKTLKAYFEVILEEKQRSLEAALVAAKGAVDTALISAKEAVSVALTNAKEAVYLAQQSAKEATEKADHAQELRNSVSNEWRQQSLDQTATYMTKVEANPRFEQIMSTLDRNRQDIQKMLPREEYKVNLDRQTDFVAANKRTSTAAYVAIGITVLNILVTLLFFLITKR